MSAVPKPFPQPFLMQGIPSHAVPHFWQFALPYVKRALDHASGELTPEDIKQGCLSRGIQLWLISREKRIFGAITTEIVVYPQRKHCRVITLAGSDFDSWVHVADATLCAWAKEQGCDALEAYVRKGFVNRLSALRFRHKYSVVVKGLREES